MFSFFGGGSPLYEFQRFCIRSGETDPFKGRFQQGLFAYKNVRFASSFLLLRIGFLEASKKQISKFVFQKSLSETPFKPDRLSFCTPKRKGIPLPTRGFREALQKNDSFKAEISLSGFCSKSLLENCGIFGGFLGWFFPAFFPRENGPKIPRKNPPKKSTTETKHQNPQVVSGRG